VSYIPPNFVRTGSRRSGGGLEAPVDLGTHDGALGQWVVETAQQRRLEIFPSVLEAGDLFVEGVEPAPADGLPLTDVGGVDDALDVVERQPGVLQHPDEDQPSQCGGEVPTLPGAAGIGPEEPASLVIPDGRGRHAGAAGQLADGHEVVVGHRWFAHATS
jgi:hypothetical protein